MNIIWFLLIGLAAGFIAGNLMKGRGFGLIGNTIVGVLGGVIGGAVFDAIGLYPDSLLASLIAAVVGACILLFAISLVKQKGD